MSLFSTINQSAGALRASQMGLQVVGNNIANANTPGYIRQELELIPASATRVGELIIGQGVIPKATRQIIDQALAERMWNASTAAAGADSLQAAYTELEDLVGGLNGGGLEAQLDTFNEALHNLSNAPADPAARELVLEQASALTNMINQTYQQATAGMQRANDQLPGVAIELNSLTSRIADLNLEIMVLEGGRALSSDATGLRDERYQLLEQMAKIVDINVQEQASGSVSVFVGGDYLVSEKYAREVYTAYDSDTQGQEIRIVETDSPLQAKGGRVGATTAARDEVWGAYVEELDEFAANLASVFNQVHSQGQGSLGHTSMSGVSNLEPGVPLERAGLQTEPSNGTFDIQVVDAKGELVSTHRINVQKLDIIGDSTINSIVADIDAIDGIQASVDGSGMIQIESESPGMGFTFSDDNSGFLAAAGLNTFFTGTTASTISVNSYLVDNPDQLSVSKSGVGQDTNALADLVDLIKKPQEQFGGLSLQSLQQRSLGSIAQRVSVQRSSADGVSDFYETLRAQHLSITGVNLDEEAIKMITYQRAFQASSRVIATASEMLELLVNL